MPDELTLDEVRHVARLARLRMTDRQLDEYRSQLATVIAYVAKLSELDVTDVEPLAHPTDQAARLDDDLPAEPLPTRRLLDLAPAVEDRFLAVPKILADDAGG